jgi:hypothetical protein
MCSKSLSVASKAVVIIVFSIIVDDSFLVERRKFFVLRERSNQPCDFKDRPVSVPTAVNAVPTAGFVDL